MVASADKDCGHVAVAGGDPAAVVKLDEVAVAAAVPTRAQDGTIGGRVDRRAVFAGEVNSGMHGGAGAERIGAHTVAAGEDNAGLDRLFRGDGYYVVLKLVELLPALEQRLEGGIADALERTADAGRLASRRGLDAKPLKFGGGDLVADVERSGDERRLLKLVLLDTRQRAIPRETAVGGGGSDHLRIDLLTGQRRLDQRLALLDQARPRLSRGGEAGMRAGDEARRGIACPCEHAEKEDEEDNLDRSGNAETAEFPAVVNEEVAVAEQCRRAGQCMHHQDPLQKAPDARAEARCAVVSIAGAPQPQAVTRCPRASAKWTLLRDG